VWQGVREHRGVLWAAGGVLALGAYGFVATFQADTLFGRILSAYGGVFVGGSLAWGVVVDGFRPDRWDLIGATVCLLGVAVIMHAPGLTRAVCRAGCLASPYERESPERQIMAWANPRSTNWAPGKVAP
jgi:small multidrug resistance family-3 protein